MAFTFSLCLSRDAHMTFFKWIDDERFLCGWVSRKWDLAWIVVGDVPSKTMYSVCFCIDFDHASHSESTSHMCDVLIFSN